MLRITFSKNFKLLKEKNLWKEKKKESIPLINLINYERSIDIHIPTGLRS